METNNNGKGEFRCLTPAEIGNAVAQFRKSSGMKQTTLAYEAGNMEERTIQRLEKGEKVSQDTLRRVAKALRLDENAFIGARYVPTKEEALETAAKFLSEVFIIDAEELTDVRGVGRLFDAHAYLVDDRHVPSGLSAEIAVFKDQLQDWGDIYPTISHTERLKACESVLANAHSISAAGFRLLYGVYETADKFRVSTVAILPRCEEVFNQLKQLIVPRQFMSMIG